MPHSLKLIGPRKTYTLRFETESEKKEWINKIQSCVSKVLNESNAPDEENRFGHYKFPEKFGAEYEGWWKVGKIHGQGTLRILDNVYTGEWADDRKCGLGTYQSVCGEVYHGDWKDDRPRMPLPLSSFLLVPFPLSFLFLTLLLLSLVPPPFHYPSPPFPSPFLSSSFLLPLFPSLPPLLPFILLLMLLNLFNLVKILVIHSYTPSSTPFFPPLPLLSLLSPLPLSALPFLFLFPPFPLLSALKDRYLFPFSFSPIFLILSDSHTPWWFSLSSYFLFQFLFPLFLRSQC